MPVAIVAIVALVASLSVNVVQAQRTADLQEDLTQTRADLATVEEEVAELRQDLAQAEAQADGGDAPDLDELPGMDELGDLGGLEDLLGGLFGGDGDAGGLEDLLGGLFGGGGDMGGLEDLLGDLGGAGDLDVQAISQCVTGVVTPGSLSVPDTSAEEQVPVIVEQVSELRGAEFDQPVEPVFQGPEEFQAEVRERFEEDLDPELVEQETQMLRLLGVLDDDQDVGELYLDLIEGAAAGFYDPETGAIHVLVTEPDAPLTPVAQSTLAHEIEHALTDQELGLGDLEELAEADADAGIARLSVVEGSAVLLQQQWMTGAFSLSQQLELAQDPLVQESQAQLDGFPHYLQAELLFPYEQGLNFICGQYNDQGGWDGVDAAFTDDGPTTTAEILNPERLGQELGAVPELGAPGGAFEETVTTTFGAAQLQWLLEAPGNDTEAALTDAAAKAAAWNGGTQQLWADDDDAALGLAFSQGDGESLCDTLGEWYGAAFGQTPSEGDAGLLVASDDDQAMALSCDEDGVTLGIAPDPDTAAAIAG